MKHKIRLSFEDIVVILLASAFALFIAAYVLKGPILGTYPFGAETTITAKVTKTYVDARGDLGSAYMVTTDKGVFEVDNSLWLWIWDADKIYGKIEAGKTYLFETKGREILNFLLQDYPGIISATEVKENE